MMNWHSIYVLVGLTALSVGLVSTWIFRKLSWKVGFLDVPMSEGHKRHADATPLLGGAGMTVAWLEEHGVPDMRADFARVSVIRYRLAADRF